MSEHLVDSARIHETLRYYRPLGLVEPILVGGASLTLQLERHGVNPKLNDIDTLASYVSIRSLASAVRPGNEVAVTERRFSTKVENGIRDRAALKLSPNPILKESPGIVTLQAFTGVETDRVTLLYDDIKARGAHRTVDGVDCVSIAEILAWKILADRVKDRVQVSAILEGIKEQRAVSYDEWDEIRSAVEAARATRDHSRREQILWSAT